VGPALGTTPDSYKDGDICLLNENPDKIGQWKALKVGVHQNQRRRVSSDAHERAAWILVAADIDSSGNQ